jgi:hypothetical protein
MSSQQMNSQSSQPPKVIYPRPDRIACPACRAMAIAKTGEQS